MENLSLQQTTDVAHIDESIAQVKVIFLFPIPQFLMIDRQEREKNYISTTTFEFQFEPVFR